MRRTELADNKSRISSWLESVIFRPLTASISSPERKYAPAADPPGEQNFISTKKDKNLLKFKKSLPGWLSPPTIESPRP